MAAAEAAGVELTPCGLASRDSLRLEAGMPLYGNELVEFTTYFSIGYALFIVPSQMIQTRVRPSLFLPACEIIWGAVTLVTYKAPNAKVSK